VSFVSVTAARTTKITEHHRDIESGNESPEGSQGAHEREENGCERDDGVDCETALRYVPRMRHRRRRALGSANGGDRLRRERLETGLCPPRISRPSIIRTGR
jgi:hypothetical protein